MSNKWEAHVTHEFVLSVDSNLEEEMSGYHKFTATFTTILPGLDSWPYSNNRATTRCITYQNVEDFPRMFNRALHAMRFTLPKGHPAYLEEEYSLWCNMTKQHERAINGRVPRCHCDSKTRCRFME